MVIVESIRNEPLFRWSFESGSFVPIQILPFPLMRNFSVGLETRSADVQNIRSIQVRRFDHINAV